MKADTPWPVPSGWRWCRFDEVARVASNLVKPADFPDWPHIAPNHIESQTGRLLPFRTTRQDGVTSAKHRFSAGQVLYSKIRPYLAKVVVADFDGLCSADMYPIESDLEPRFLKWWMLTREFTRRAAGEQARTVLPKINVRGLSALPIPVPPLGEQRRIVEILEDHLSRIDAAERYLENALWKGALAEGAARQAVLLGAAECDAGAVSALATERERRCPADMKRGRPKAAPAAAVHVPWAGHWPTVSLEQATDPVRTISYGILKPGPNLDTGVPYVRVLNMHRDILALDDLHRTSTGIAAQYARASLEPDDVLVSIRGTYGRVVLVPKELQGGNITQDTARLALLPQLLPTFVALVLRSPWAQAHLKLVARGVAVKGVNITDLRQLPIPLPSLNLQAQLVDRAEGLSSDLRAATWSAQVGLRRAGSLRRALLAAAFSGRLTRQADGLGGSDD